MTTLYSLAIFSFFSTAARQQCFRKLPKTLSNPTEDLIPNTLVNGLITTNYASVISILSSQINLNSPCFAHYFSPLHIACVLLNETFVRLLLGYGANCRARTPAGDTCLHIVVKTQAHAASPQLRSRLCGLLLMAGCDPLAARRPGLLAAVVRCSVAAGGVCHVGPTTCSLRPCCWRTRRSCSRSDREPSTVCRYTRR